MLGGADPSHALIKSGFGIIKTRVTYELLSNMLCSNALTLIVSTPLATTLVVHDLCDLLSDYVS